MTITAIAIAKVAERPDAAAARRENLANNETL
jgi:hypothetical protein